MNLIMNDSNRKIGGKYLKAVANDGKNDVFNH